MDLLEPEAPVQLLGAGIVGPDLEQHVLGGRSLLSRISSVSSAEPIPRPSCSGTTAIVWTSAIGSMHIRPA